MTDIPHINSQLNSKTPRNSSKAVSKANSRKPKTSGVQAQLHRLQKLIDTKIQNSSTPDSSDRSTQALSEFLRYSDILKDLAGGHSVEVSRIKQLVESLHNLAQTEISESELQKSHLQEYMKSLSNACKASGCSQLKELAKAAKRLRHHWKTCACKSEEDESYVADKDLRKNVCRKIASVFERKEFNKEVAQELALRIEANLRRKDPMMSKKCLMHFRKMMKDIKCIDPEVYSAIRSDKL